MTQLRHDRNVLAIAQRDFTGIKDEKITEKCEILVIVSMVPFDLDISGRKQIEKQDAKLILNYDRPERIKTAIYDEAGCWFISGKILYSKTLHDPNGLIVDLRKTINSVSEERKLAAFRSCMDQVRMYPDIAFKRRSSSKSNPLEMILGENVAIARALFILNNRPPRSEELIIKDLMSLKKLPRGFEDIFDIINRLDRIDAKKFRKAKKMYDGMIAEIESLWRS